MALKLVGNPKVKRVDSLERINGRARYTNDVTLPNMLWARVVLSPYAHAIIKNVDVSAVEARGFPAITGKDLPTHFRMANKVTVMATDRARWAGQIVAAVAGPTEWEAEDHARLVKVEYEPLPPVLDPEEALKPDAPQLYPTGNIATGRLTQEVGERLSIQTKVGDVAKGFAEADVVVERKYRTSVWQHATMEPRAAVARWEQGKLEVWSSNQWSHLARVGLANFFNIPLTQVRVQIGEGNFMGGGFGDKVGIREEIIIAALLSKKAGGQPVKLVYSRAETFLDATHRFPILAHIKVGAKRDGKITAIWARLIVDVGANGGVHGADSLSDLVQTYVSPNYDVAALSVHTNNYTYPAFMRDVGETQGHFFMESIADEVAEKLGMDPVEFRLLNMRSAKRDPFDPVTKRPYSGLGQPDALLKAAELAKWKEKWKGWGKPSWTSPDGTKVRGAGVMILNSAKGSMSPPMSAQVQIDPDGKVTLFSGAADKGGGQKTALSIIGAEVLGLTSLDNVKIITADTDVTTDTGVTAGSRQTRSGGFGMFKAAEDARNQLFKLVAEKLKVDTKDLEAVDNRIQVKGNPSRSLTFKEATALSKTPIKGNASVQPPRAPDGGSYFFRTTAGAVAEVEVDLLTGLVRVVSYAGVHDTGRTIFYQGAVNQIRGGLTSQGIGQAFFEEQLVDPITGKYINPNWHDYRSPTFLDVPNPEDVHADFIEYVDPVGPFGAKGIGEPALNTTLAAIANALHNAIGVRPTSAPFTPEKVLGWLKSKGVSR